MTRALFAVLLTFCLQSGTLAGEAGGGKIEQEAQPRATASAGQAPASVDAAGDAPLSDEEERESSFTIFSPSEDVSADKAVSFPVDI